MTKLFMAMKTTGINTLLAITLACMVCSCAGKGKVYHLYYLGGQSNMDGYGFVAELPEAMKPKAEGIMIFHGNTAGDNTEPDGKGSWQVLQPGHGAGFKCDSDTNYYSNRFGVELSFALRLKELLPGENIAIIKYSRGGTSIDTLADQGAGCWLPDCRRGNGVNQYDHFTATMRNAMSQPDIDGDGKPDRLIPSGIIWMQGESDALVEYSAMTYKDNLETLTGEIRKTLGSVNIPVVIGRISDSGNDTDSTVWTYGSIVRDAQAGFVKEDANAALVTKTDDYQYSDPWHYDSKGFIDLGIAFADALVALRKP